MNNFAKALLVTVVTIAIIFAGAYFGNKYKPLEFVIGFATGLIVYKLEHIWGKW